MQHGKLSTDHCPWFIVRLFQLSYTYISDIFTAGSRNSYTASRINQKWESMSDRVRGDPSRGPAETENPNEIEDTETVLGDLLRDLPEWLKRFTENLVDDSVPEHRDASSSSR